MYLDHLTLKISYFTWGQNYKDQDSAHIQLPVVCKACFLAFFLQPCSLVFNYLTFFLPLISPASS